MNTHQRWCIDHQMEYLHQMYDIPCCCLQRGELSLGDKAQNHGMIVTGSITVEAHCLVIWTVLLFIAFVRCNADSIDIVECQCHIFFSRDKVFVVKILNKTIIQFSYQHDYIDQTAATPFTLSWLFGITSYASFTKWNQGKHNAM